MALVPPSSGYSRHGNTWRFTIGAPYNILTGMRMASTHRVAGNLEYSDQLEGDRLWGALRPEEDGVATLTTAIRFLSVNDELLKTMITNIRELHVTVTHAVARASKQP